MRPSISFLYQKHLWKIYQANKNIPPRPSRAHILGHCWCLYYRVRYLFIHVFKYLFPQSSASDFRWHFSSLGSTKLPTAWDDLGLIYCWYSFFVSEIRGIIGYYCPLTFTPISNRATTNTPWEAGRMERPGVNRLTIRSKKPNINKFEFLFGMITDVHLFCRAHII